LLSDLLFSSWVNYSLFYSGTALIMTALEPTRCFIPPFRGLFSIVIYNQHQAA
jgi:hypothetical protein